MTLKVKNKLKFREYVILIFKCIAKKTTGQRTNYPSPPVKGLNES